jgi:hypothetical protein
MNKRKHELGADDGGDLLDLLVDVNPDELKQEAQLPDEVKDTTTTTSSSKNPNVALQENKLYFRNIDINEHVKFVHREWKNRVFVRATDVRFKRDLMVIHPYSALRHACIYPYGNFLKGKYEAKHLNQAVRVYGLLVEANWHKDYADLNMPLTEDGMDKEMVDFFAWLDALHHKYRCYIAEGHPKLAELEVKNARTAAVMRLAKHYFSEGKTAERLIKSNVANVSDEEKNSYRVYQEMINEIPELAKTKSPESVIQDYINKCHVDDPNWLKCIRPVPFEEVVNELEDIMEPLVKRKPGQPVSFGGVLRPPKRPVVNFRRQVFRPMFSDRKEKRLKTARPPSFPNKVVANMFDRDFQFLDVIMKDNQGNTVPLEKRMVKDGDIFAGAFTFAFKDKQTKGGALPIEMEPQVLYFYARCHSNSQQQDLQEQIEMFPVVQEANQEHENEYQISEEEARALLCDDFDESLLVALKKKDSEEITSSSSAAVPVHVDSGSSSSSSSSSTTTSSSAQAGAK